MFSMTDVIGAILIGLFVAAISFGLINSGFSKSKIASTEQDVVSMRMQIQKLFANTSGNGYSGLTNGTAVSAGVVPKTFIKGDSDLRHTWGGPITLSSNSENVSFLIDMEEIPHDACVELAHFQTGEWFSVSVNGTEIEPETEVMDVVANCSAGNDNQIIFEAR
jgi:hypothetical protein